MTLAAVDMGPGQASLLTHCCSSTPLQEVSPAPCYSSTDKLGCFLQAQDTSWKSTLITKTTLKLQKYYRFEEWPREVRSREGSLHVDTWLAKRKLIGIQCHAVFPKEGEMFVAPLSYMTVLKSLVDEVEMLFAILNARSHSHRSSLT